MGKVAFSRYITKEKCTLSQVNLQLYMAVWPDEEQF